MGAVAFHVTSAHNRESIRRHGLDWRRMLDDPGIAGSVGPEAERVFLARDPEEAEWFVEMGRRHDGAEPRRALAHRAPGPVAARVQGAARARAAVRIEASATALRTAATAANATPARAQPARMSATKCSPP
jgi:hypothetical protein